jgi:glycosyltransferase involved in cell wall biosynthesis
MAQKLVLISINASWNIVNFRRGLIAALQARGYRVAVAAPEDEYTPHLLSLGVEYIPLPMDKQGISPARDLRLLLRYRQVLRQLHPDVFLGYTAKPNVYGALAGRLLSIPVINNIAGLGTAFIKRSWLTSVMTNLYRIALSRSSTVFFQNSEDMRLFIAHRMVRPAQARLLPGSGVDINLFQPQECDAASGGVRFLLAGRLLWDKGVCEFIEAARAVRRVVPDARFQILGFADVENRTAVPRAALDQWVNEGLVEYLGHSDDVRPFIAAADCVVLPSYREGLPRVLLEAAAMAKPLIATDVPGCQHVVEDGRNGFLCAARSSGSLAEAMLRMAALSSDERRAMGTAGRARVEAEFDERIVIERYLAAIRDATDGQA